MKKFNDSENLYAIDLTSMHILESATALGIRNRAREFETYNDDADFYNGGMHLTAEETARIPQAGILPMLYDLNSEFEFYAVTSNGCVYHNTNAYYFTLGCISHLIETDGLEYIIIGDCIKLVKQGTDVYPVVIHNTLQTGDAWLNFYANGKEAS
nr:MAG TPA: hypothetical protein [Caudoviricetes sp.]